MKIAIFSRPGACFPNVISIGLSKLLDELGAENKIFYDSIPMLMRLLPLHKKQKRWHNSFQFRVRNKLSNFFRDRKLIKEVNQFDAIIISECYPNAFWKNYFAIEELKKKFSGVLISYTESPLDSAPVNKAKQLDADDYDESIYDYNLFVAGLMEVKTAIHPNQAVIGVNISCSNALMPAVRKEFVAVVDFPQTGFESYRNQQLLVLDRLGIKTVVLEGRYPIEAIRKIYSEASVFFLSFPETYGLPISECLACGTYIFTPDSSWPMAWRLNENPASMGPGLLPDCFRVYQDENDLEAKLSALIKTYDVSKTPVQVFRIYLDSYEKFYRGDKKELERLLAALKTA